LKCSARPRPRPPVGEQSAIASRRRARPWSVASGLRPGLRGVTDRSSFSLTIRGPAFLTRLVAERLRRLRRPHAGRARPLSRRRAGGHGACPAGHDGSEPFEIKSFFGAGISGPRAPRFRYRYDAARLACRSAVTAARPHRRPGAPLTNARHGARAPPGGRIDVTSSIPQSNRGRLRARMRSWLRSVSRVVQMRPVHPKRSQHRLAPQGSPVVLERAEVDQLLDVIGPAYNPSLRSLARPRGPARSSALRRSRPSCARQGNDRYASTSPAGVACGPASANLDQNLFL
jgi:hypothetical protein